MNYTLELARFCAELEYDQLPAEVKAKARQCVLDFCGVVVGSRKIEISKKAAEFVRNNQQDGPSSVIGHGIKTSAPLAALANGTFAEILELQDGLRKGGNHPLSSMTPAALALSEALGISGRDFLAAVVAGYEAENRVASVMAPSHLKRGYLPNGTAGAVGAAVAASRLMGLDARKTAEAMGIAAFIAPVSIGENLWGGYTIKIVHGGQAARVGIEAAQWAQLGFTGCPLEGSPQRERGFCAVLSDDPDYSQMTEGLGEVFTILDIYPKPYSACRVTHSSADATLSLIKEHDLKPEDVDGVTVSTYEYAAQTVGANYPDGTDNFLKCQFSIPYVVAACILERGVNLPQFTADKIKSPRFMEMSKRVKVVGDPEMNKLWPATRPSLVEIKTKDGRTLAKQVNYPLGDPRNPFTAEMFEEKFNLLISFGLGENRAPEIKQLVRELEDAPDVKGLTAALE